MLEDQDPACSRIDIEAPAHVPGVECRGAAAKGGLEGGGGRGAVGRRRAVLLLLEFLQRIVEIEMDGIERLLLLVGGEVRSVAVC